jgi:hypothetical protein
VYPSAIDKVVNNKNIVKKKNPSAPRIWKWKILASVLNADAKQLTPKTMSQNHRCESNTMASTPKPNSSALSIFGMHFYSI